MGKLFGGIKPIQFFCVQIELEGKYKKLKMKCPLARSIDIYFRWCVCVTQLSEYNIVLGFALYLQILHICIVRYLCFITMV